MINDGGENRCIVSKKVSSCVSEITCRSNICIFKQVLQLSE